MEWFGSQRTHSVKWSSQSSNVNPTENRWQELEIPVQRHLPFNLTDQLFSKKEWSHISEDVYSYDVRIGTLVL